MIPESKIVKRKLMMLSEITGKGKIQTLNYALDVALAFERTRIKLIDLEKAIKAGVEYLASLKYLIKKSKELL